MSEVTPFPLAGDDVNDEKLLNRRKVSVVRRKPQYEQLSEDALWLLEQDMRLLRSTIEQRGTHLTTPEHARLIKSAEQIRRMRLADATLHKAADPSALDDEELDAEFEERCRREGLDPEKVQRVFSL